MFVQCFSCDFFMDLWFCFHVFFLWLFYGFCLWICGSWSNVFHNKWSITLFNYNISEIVHATNICCIGFTTKVMTCGLQVCCIKTTKIIDNVRTTEIVTWQESTSSLVIIVWLSLWQLYMLKLHFPTTKDQKTTHIQLSCNCLLGISTIVQLSP